jgi:hypothetical protein
MIWLTFVDQAGEGRIVLTTLVPQATMPEAQV